MAVGNDKYIRNMSKEERKEAGRKGGIASGKARREKRKIKDILEIVMNTPVKEGRMTKPENIKNLGQMNDINVDTLTAMVIAQVYKAINGDTNAFLAIRDSLGQKPIDKIEQSVNEVVVIKDDI